MKQNFTKAIFLAFTFLFSFTTTQAQTPFWTEDFSGGDVPSGWTNVETSGAYSNAVWTWCNDPGATSATAGCPDLWTDGNNLQGPFASTSVNNGFLTLNSDLINATPASPHISELTTTSINCSGQSEVWFVSQNHIGVFELDADPNAIAQVSNDGGTTWTDFILFPGLVAGGTDVGSSRWSFNPQIPVIDITTVAAGQMDVMIRFQWTAGWEYHWSIDDLALYPEDPTNLFVPANEVAALRGAAGNNGGTPVSQIYPVSFLLDIGNNGTNPATNVQATATIQDLTTNNVVFTETIDIGTIDPLNNDDDSDVAFDNIWPGRYTPPATVNAYRGFYTVTSDSTDENTANDTLEFQFVITDSTFRKDLRNPSINGNLPGILPADPDWTYAAGYYVPNGDGLAATSVTFAVSSTDDPQFIGSTLHAILYRWDDVNGDGDAQAEERGFGNPILGGEIMGDFTYTIDGTEVNENIEITVALDNFNSTGPIMLQDDAQYILALEMFSPTGVTDAVAIVADDDINYLNSWFVNDSLSNIDPANYVPQWGAFFSGDTGFDNLLEADFGFSPHLHLNVNVPPMESVNNQLDEANKIEVFPNPANDLVTLDLELVNAFDNLNVKITDVTGKSMLETNYQNVWNEQFQYDVTNYAAGTYFLHVRTDEGNRVLRFVVVK